MKIHRQLVLCAWLLTSPFLLAQTPDVKTSTPAEVFSATLVKTARAIEPPNGATAQTFSTHLKIIRADGLPKELLGRELDLAFQAPDRLRLQAVVEGETYSFGRDGQQLWVHAPAKKFGIIGAPDRPRFASAPDKIDPTKLGRLKLPLSREQLSLATLLFKLEGRPAEMVGGVNCQVLFATPPPEAAEAFKIPAGQWQLWVRDTDKLPARIGYSDGKGVHVIVELQHMKFEEPWAAAKWKLNASADEKIETVALAHLMRFIPVALSSFDQNIPTLGPATGERRVVATHGNGRLEVIDGTKVLFVKGTPEEMGEQHGRLLKKEIHDVVNRILYGIGVGSSFTKGRWFFGEIESAQNRLNPFIDERYLREMDSLALAAGIDKEEARLANFFPELFHCSGFALFGNATVGGRMFHGRILDYMKGVGLEQNAVVMVFQPDKGNAWVNVSYAGFVGSVTAMNEKHIAIGEMGGRGEGAWDGKPMAQLMREVMEKANTLDEAIAIMRKGPRTCEYYYVISDAKSKRAVGIAATPTRFEVVEPGAAHPQLPHPVKDTVLMSAGDRYDKLSERVKHGFGKFDADSARDLMTRPVCMGSNIHSVLFAPDTLDFWVANADSKNPASHTRYTKYNLGELLKGEPAPPAKSAAVK